MNAGKMGLSAAVSTWNHMAPQYLEGMIESSPEKRRSMVNPYGLYA